MTLGGLVFSLFILIELPEIFQMTLGGLIFSLFILIDQEPSRLVLFTYPLAYWPGVWSSIIQISKNTVYWIDHWSLFLLSRNAIPLDDIPFHFVNPLFLFRIPFLIFFCFYFPQENLVSNVAKYSHTCPIINTIDQTNK